VFLYRMTLFIAAATLPV